MSLEPLRLRGWMLYWVIAGVAWPSSMQPPTPLRALPWRDGRTMPSTATDSLQPAISVLDSIFSTAHGRPTIEQFASVRLGNVPLVIFRVETGGGTGGYLTGYAVFVTSDGTAPHLVWSAFASETFAGEPVAHSTPYRVSGCLFLAGDSALGYDLAASDEAGLRALAYDKQNPEISTHAPVRSSGYYALSAHDVTMRYAAPRDSVLTSKCRSSAADIGRAR